MVDADFEKWRSLSQLVQQHNLTALRTIYDIIDNFLSKIDALQTNELVINDLKFSQGLITNAVAQLQPVEQKLDSVPGLNELKELMVQVEEYIADDVCDMPLLTLDAAVESVPLQKANTTKEEVEGSLIQGAHNLVTQLKQIAGGYKEKGLEYVCAMLDESVATSADLAKAIDADRI